MSHVVVDGQHVLEQQVSTLKSYLFLTCRCFDLFFQRRTGSIVRNRVVSEVILRRLKWRCRRDNDGGARAFQLL